CRGGGGDGLRLAGDRPPALRGHHLPRFPDRARRRAVGRRDARDRQLDGRHPLRGDRPAHPIGEVAPMSTPADIIALPSQPPRQRTRRRMIWLRDFPVIPTAILLVIALVAVFANQLAPHNPEIGSLTARFKPPFWQTGGSMKYIISSEPLRREVLSRLIFGARVSMVVGIMAVLVAGVVGT